MPCTNDNYKVVHILDINFCINCTFPNCMHPSGHTMSFRRRNLVENRWTTSQRDINVILTSFCERWFNISIQTSKQRRYSVRRFDLKFRRCFNVGKVTSIQFAFSTFVQRHKGSFNVGSTLKQRHFARWDFTSSIPYVRNQVWVCV